MLADTEETLLENRRVLSINSSYKKRVKGRILGIVVRRQLRHIEPEINVKLNRQQDQLHIQEHHELHQIFAMITDQLRGQENNLKAFQRLLVRFDIYNAKVRLLMPMMEFAPRLIKPKAILGTSYSSIA